MSYDVNFVKNNKTVELPQKHQIAGGTYAVGGTTSASLNITYNYSRFFVKAFGSHDNDNGGLNMLHKKSLSEVIPMLEKAIKRLKDEPPDEDYWKATEGNARTALQDLLELASMVQPIEPTAHVEIS
jgi:hypothetical protein